MTTTPTPPPVLPEPDDGRVPESVPGVPASPVSPVSPDSPFSPDSPGSPPSPDVPDADRDPVEVVDPTEASEVSDRYVNVIDATPEALGFPVQDAVDPQDDPDRAR